MTNIVALEHDLFMEEALNGLTKQPRELPCKYFYDKRGSKLFEAICHVEEYYPTRTELSIMAENIEDISHLVGPDALIVEFGSGSCLKTRILLKALQDPAGFIPIDISKDALDESTRLLKSHFPDLEIAPVYGDFVHLPPLPVLEKDYQKTVIYFPGSTIGNLEPSDAVDFLHRTSVLCESSGALLVGVDLQKEKSILEAAYNDRQGVTAAFNKNILLRMNRELGADFNIENFAHEAVYNEEDGCIEMHLISRSDEYVRVGNKEIFFRKGESILTERSYKYTLDGFRQMALCAGFHVKKVWVDSRRLFSVQYLSADGR